MRGDISYRRPPILDRIPKDRHAVIEASAGTGKTYTIEHLFVELLLQTDCSIDNILVLTYTERAAGELRSRIRTMIEKILSPAAGTTATEGMCWIIGPDARIKLEQSLFSFDKAPIHTIHGFFQRVIIENAFSSARLFEQTLVDSRTVFSEAFRQALRRDLARDARLSAYLSCWLGPGDSDVDDLEAFLYRCHAKKREIRPLFDADAVADAAGRIFSCLRAAPVLDEVNEACRKGKVHWKRAEWIVKTLRNLRTALETSADARGLPQFLAAINPADIGKASGHLTSLSTLNVTVRTLLSALQELAKVIVPFEAAVAQVFLPPVQARLESDKKQKGLYDFDDMIGYLRDGLRGPQGAALLAGLRRRYRYALIDESQDTDQNQWDVFRRVFYESGGTNLIYLIGDPKQAIYGFRGADVHTYLAARAEICGTARPVSLNENYRSTDHLIAAYNEIFRHDTEHPFFNDDIVYDSPVECGRPELRAVGQDGRDVSPVVIFEIRPEEGRLNAGEYRRQLGRRIAREIGQLLAVGGRMLRFGAGADLKPPEPSDIFILTRKEREGREVSEFLRDEGIPFAFYKQEGLFQTREAEHVRDLLAAVERPLVQSGRFKAWMTPFFSVPLEGLTACRDLPETEPLVSRLAGWHDRALRRDFQGLFSAILSESGLISREIFLKESERELTNYLHIFEILLEETATTGCDLPELNRRLRGFIAGTGNPAREEANIQRLETEKQAVQIMTMHKSKGLEAAVVFLYGGYTQGPGEGLALYHDGGRRLLSIRPGEAVEEEARREVLQEEQRLLYVAVTRAKARLYLPLVSPDCLSDHAREASYFQLNRRLADMMPHFGEPGLRRLFAHEIIQASPPRSALPGADVAEIVAAWQPDPTLLAGPEASEPSPEMRRLHSGFAVTSYTRIKHMRGGRVSPLEADGAPDQDIGYGPGEPADQSVPAGPEYGAALHRILELVPYEPLQRGAEFEEWRSLDEVKELVTDSLLRHGVGLRHADYSSRLAYNALKARVALGDGPLLPGFGSLAHCRREAAFLYPYPEEDHSRLDEAGEGPFRIGRGYVKGFIDLLFEHEGKLYIADWKTDTLADYHGEALAHHVEANYALQSKLYSIAAAKTLGVRSSEAYDDRFGGLLYCFVRAMESPGDGRRGMVTARPSWQELLKFERKMLMTDEYIVPRAGAD